MSKILILSLAILSILSCNNESENTKPDEMATPKQSAVNTLTEEEEKDGWKLLFDGKSMNGWHKYGGEPVGSAWKVNDSSIFLDASQVENWQIKGGGDIVTDEDFEDFHLKLDWKVDSNGNSGIIFYIHEDSVKYEWPWMTGPEMQVLDNNGHPDAKINKHRAGDLYDLISSSKETVKPALEWNQVEIKSEKGKLDLYLNGVNIVSTMMWDDNWKKLISESKFKTVEGFGAYKKGKLGLQDHGNNVWFRNVRIKRL
jgi:hypothetical protein